MKTTALLFVCLFVASAAHGGNMDGMQHLEMIQSHKDDGSGRSEEDQLLRHMGKIKIAGRAPEHNDPAKLKGLLKTLQNKEVHEKQWKEDMDRHGLHHHIESKDGERKPIYPVHQMETLKRRKANLRASKRFDKAVPHHKENVVLEDGKPVHLDDLRQMTHEELNAKYVQSLRSKRMEQKLGKASAPIGLSSEEIQALHDSLPPRGHIKAKSQAGIETSTTAPADS